MRHRYGLLALCARLDHTVFSRKGLASQAQSSTPARRASAAHGDWAMDLGENYVA
jgi:invasion protein IalB